MLSRLVYDGEGRGRPQREERYGLPLLQARVPQTGWHAGGSLRRAARGFRRAGGGRVLVPEGFSAWPLLERYGLRRVDPVPFLRAHAAPLTLALLARMGVPPQQACVALRGREVDRSMVQAAQILCPQVREIAVSAPGGGERLARWLREEYGLPVRPDGEDVDAVVRFHPGTEKGGRGALSLFGPQPALAGIQVSAPTLEEGDRRDLGLLCALWETEKLGKRPLEFT